MLASIRLNEKLCIECAGCVMLCPCFAIHYIDRHPEIDAKRCNLCGICIEGCPYGALTLEKEG